jgi:hypothetical protein
MKNLRLDFAASMSILCLLAGFAAAPVAHALPAGPKADVWLGYSRLGSNAFYPNVAGLNGWQGALNVKIKRFVGIEGDVAQYGWGANATVPHTTTVLFGPRVTLGAMRFKVFVHGLGGIEHSANSSGPSISSSAVTYAGGGGLDLPLAPFFGWRVMADYVNAPTLSPASSSHARYSTGVVFRF